MSEALQQRPASPTPDRVRLFLRRLALVLLICGLGIAAAIWIRQDRLERATPASRNQAVHQTTMLDPLSPDDSGRYAHDVELYYGKSGLLMDKATRWFESLWTGKRLAWTVAALTILVFGLLRLLVVLYRPEAALPSPPARAAAPKTGL